VRRRCGEGVKRVGNEAVGHRGLCRLDILGRNYAEGKGELRGTKPGRGGIENESRGTGTSAMWNVTCFARQTTLAPILISFSPSVVNDQCFTVSATRPVLRIQTSIGND
jgi:hypothetical protein